MTVKKLLIVIVLVCYSLIVFSQEDTNHIKFAATITSLPDLSFNITNGMYLTTQGTIIKNQSLFSLGPVWWIYNNKQGVKFWGVLGSYHYSPRMISKSFKFYFLADIAYFHQTNGYNQSMEYMPTVYYDVDFKSTIQTIRLHAGLGFKLKVFKNLFLNQGLCTGMDLYNYTSETNVSGHPELNGKYSNGSIFNNMLHSNAFKTGLEYDIK